MCQIQHSMKILAKSCLLFQWDVETRGAFPYIFNISDKSPRVCFIEKHKQHFIDILLFAEATKMKKENNCVILSLLFFAMVNSYLIVYYAITCVKSPVLV